jgi:putative addiction module killer protein
MLHLPVIDLSRYQQQDGREPYTEWFPNLRDQMAKARIESRLRQVQSGNPGDWKSVGDGVNRIAH